MLKLFKKKQRKFYTLEVDKRIANAVFHDISDIHGTKHSTISEKGEHTYPISVVSTLDEGEFLGNILNMYGNMCNISKNGNKFKVLLKES